MKIEEIYKDIKVKPTTDEIKTVLEIGPAKGLFSNFLQESGIEVTAIDVERPVNLSENVNFKMIKFEDYNPDMIFDLVHARNVVPFFSDKPKQLERMLKMGRYVYFTFFGPHDPWAELGRTIAKEEIFPVLKNHNVVYFREEEFEGPTMKGDFKPWHIFTVLVKTNNGF